MQGKKRRKKRIKFKYHAWKSYRVALCPEIRRLPTLLAPYQHGQLSTNGRFVIPCCSFPPLLSTEVWILGREKKPQMKKLASSIDSREQRRVSTNTANLRPEHAAEQTGSDDVCNAREPDPARRAASRATSIGSARGRARLQLCTFLLGSGRVCAVTNDINQSNVDATSFSSQLSLF